MAACSGLVRQILRTFSSGNILLYRSAIRVEKLYPNSSVDYTSIPSKQSEKNPPSDASKKKEKFSGVIPTDELNIKSTKASGPGGQNVNKVSTKVEIRFHVDTASWIPEWIKPRLKEQERGKINKEGELIVTSEKTRLRMLNQADCLDKIRAMVRGASHEPKEPTEEDKQLAEARKRRASVLRLAAKRAHSLKKRERDGSDIT